MGVKTKTIVDKVYYKIGEVSRITGVKPHVLRYWESEFKEIKPFKSRSLQRLYRKKDLELLLQIKQLLYDQKYTIAGAKDRIKGSVQGERKQLALDFDRRRLEEIIAGVEASTVLAKEASVGGLQVDTRLLIQYVKNKKYLSKTGSTWSLHIRNSEDTADILTKELKDVNLNEIAEITPGSLAVEIKSSV